MPTILLLEKKKSNCKPQEGPNKWSSECYNTTMWRRLRKARLMEHPLCEKCLEEGRITPAVEVHHVIPISQAGSKLEALDIAFDANNLMSLCRKCHEEIHANDHREQWKQKKQLKYETR